MHLKQINLQHHAIKIVLYALIRKERNEAINKDRKGNDTQEPEIDEEADKVSVIAEADAVGDPRAMVVHLEDTAATAVATVVGAGRLGHVAGAAPGKLFCRQQPVLANGE